MPDIFVAPKVAIKDTKKAEESEKIKEPVELVELPSLETTEHSTNPLTAYALYPEGVRFDTQTEEEQIILLLRKHWITNLPWLFLTFFLFFAPPIISPILLTRQVFPWVPANFFPVFAAIWYLLTFGFALVNFVVWYFNVYIVTNERIIDVDFLHLLYKQVSSTRVALIQDITYKLGGVIQTLFDFGDVFIQTAGTELNFEFLAVPHPESVVRKISEIMKKSERKSL